MPKVVLKIHMTICFRRLFQNYTDQEQSIIISRILTRLTVDNFKFK